MDLKGLRATTWLVPLLLVVAVVVAVLVIGGGDDEGDPGAASPAPTTTTPTAAATKADPTTWCAAFRVFADAQAQYVAAPDSPTTRDALDAAADDLLGLGDPVGLSEGGLTALQELVDSALGQADEPTLPTEGATAPADNDALNTYLGASCPA